MTDELQIQASEGALSLNGPRTWIDENGAAGNLWVWATVVRGQVMTAAFIVSLGVDQDSERFIDAQVACRRDLEYAVAYTTSGCGAEEPPIPHRFMGDPGDPATVLVCLDCSQVKKRGFSLPGLVDMEGKATR